MSWKNKTLESLEQHIWPALSIMDQKDWLMVECHALRKKPLKDFTIENLRQLIEQDIGLKFLIPFAIEELEKDVLATGDCYASDLLYNVLSSDENFWQNNKELWQKVAQLFTENKELLLSFETTKQIRRDIFDAHKKFAAIHQGR